MNLRNVCKISFLLILSACSVKIPDIEVCGDMGDMGAACFHTISEKPRDIAKPDWDKERFGYLCMSSDSYAEIKKTILKLCNEVKCSKEVVKQTEEIDSKVQKRVKKKSAGENESKSKKN